MKKLFLLLLLPFFIWSCGPTKQEKMEAKFQYPETRKTDVTDDYFGVKVADPYRWLEDDNAEETEKWVIEQNKVTDAFLDSIPFRGKLKQRLEELWNYPRIGTPRKKGGKFFYMKNDGLQNQSVLYMKETIDGEDILLLDPNTLSEDGTVALSGYDISADGKYLAYLIARSGSDWKEIFVMNIETKELLEDHVLWAKFTGVSWYKDGFFYSCYDAPEKGKELTAKSEFHRISYHKLGTKQSEDKIIFEDKEHAKRMHYGGVTEDEKYLVAHISESSSGNALAIKDLTKPDSEFIHLVKGFDKDYSVIKIIDGIAYVHTNYQAPRYQLMKVDLANPAQENWTTLIAQNENVIQSATVLNNKLIVAYMADAKSKVEVYSLDGKHEYEFKLPGVGSLGSFSGKSDEKIAFYSFSSFTMPTTIFKYDFETKTSEEYFKPNVKFNPDEYEVKQEFFTSKDGTKVPMFIFHKKGIALDGKNPTILYGYGGFNVSLTPYFSPRRVAWIEKGGIFAIANLRGGGEYGEEWHKNGTQLKKQNVFDDCIAAAEHLIAKKYTTPDYLGLKGGSNGGLLVGAVINQRPDLFKVAIPEVGVMDMLRYHKFTIGYAWATDYGTSEDSVHFHNLIKYSPLHTIKENVKYPAVLVTTADHDDRVVPAHSFKYIATLQDKYKGPNPAMIRIEVKAGHGGGMPVSKIIDEYADLWGFTFFNMGIDPFKK